MNLRIPMWQVDAFADHVFHGNPAAVCPLESWLPDKVLQSIAQENNLAETAFFVPEGKDFRLRWFTPAAEVDLCGHATLATSWVLFHHLAKERTELTFHTQSGELKVARQGELLELDFPVRPPQPCERPFGIAEALGESPAEVMVAREYFCVFADEAQIRQMKPDMGKLAALRHFAVIVTAPAAPGRGVDFVSRFFAPLLGIPEDPVTGSAHTTLIPYWSKRLGKTTLVAEQVSARGGRLECRLDGARVRIAGRCVPFLKGEIEIPA